MRGRKFVGIAILVSILAGLGIVPAWGQTNRGAIAGSVYDTSGAAVPGASVVAVEEGTGTTYKTKSTATGNYILPSMEVGTYDLTYSKNGFKTTSIKGVVVQVSSTASINATLPVGEVQQTVSVSGSAPTIQTQTSDIGSVVTTRQVLSLPLIQGGVSAMRSPEAFVFLAPGTVGPGTANGAPTSSGVFESKITGGQNYGTEIILDGADMERSENGSSFDETAPSVEAIQEFKVLTSTLPAQYGRTTGGIEIFDMKSGTNQFHGDAYDLIRNTALDANNWFNNAVGAPRTPDKSNDYGFTFGGPVWIPKVYNGRNKTFFFFSWEQFRQTTGGSVIDTLPTTAFRSGDFSSILGGPITQNGSPVINPCTGQPILHNQIFDPTTTRLVGSQECRSPFLNNMIPSGSFNGVSTKVLSYIPSPQNGNPTENFVYNSSFPVTNTPYSIKIDENISDRNHLSGLYAYRQNNRLYSCIPALPLPISNGCQDQVFTTHYIRLNEDYTITPTLLNHLTLGYNRTNSYNVAGTIPHHVNYDQVLGISGNPGTSYLFPSFGFGDSGITSIGFGVNNITIDNGLRATDTVSWVHGNHTVTAGFYTGHQQFTPGTDSNTAGTFNFARSETAVLPTLTSQTGNGFASFLLGEVDNSSINYVPNIVRYDSAYFAAFAQDDWKVTPHFVLNLGLRWDYETPRYEVKNRISSFDAHIPNPGAGGRLGALGFAGFGPGRINARNFAGTYMKDWGPRVGFAWSPSFLGGRDKTVVRGGYGIYYGSLVYAEFGADLQDGFNTQPSFITPNGFDPIFNLSSGIPSFPLPPFIDPSLDNNGSPTYLDPTDSRPAMTQNWSLEVQRELAPDLILNVGYVGEHAIRLRSQLRYINDLNPSYFGMGNLLAQSYNSPAAVAAGIQAPYPGFNGTVAQALRPYPQYFYVNSDCCLENLGQSDFNALEVQLERRFRNGLNLMASYTWSQTLTDADSALPVFATFAGGGSVQDPFNHKDEKSISNQDIPQNFVLSYIYQLPVGKGKKFLNRGGVVNQIFGGWEIGGVQRYMSGQPFGFGCAQGIPGEDNCIRFNQVPGQPLLSAAARNGSFNPFATGIGPDGNPNNSYFNRAFFQDPNPPGGPH